MFQSFAKVTSLNSYVAHAVRFDSTDALDRSIDFNSNTDGRLGIMSVWVFMKGGDTTRQVLYTANNARIAIERRADSKIRINAFTSAAQNILQMHSTSNVVIASGWTHILAAWDMNTPRGQLFINDVDDENVGLTIEIIGTIDYTADSHIIGAQTGPTFNAKLNADIADFYINFDETLDLSIVGNRRRFIDGNLKPVDLGDTGATPTGSQPIVWMSDPVTATWGDNKGFGLGFAVIGNGLSDGDSSPSDP